MTTTEVCFEMCCLPYRAQLLFAGCIRNQGVAKGQVIRERWKYGSFHREHCVDCPSGKWVAEHRNGHRSPAPAPGPTPGGKTMESKVCRHPDCDTGDQPQPLENFKKHGARADGYDSVCKDCRAKNRKLPNVTAAKRKDQQVTKKKKPKIPDQVFIVVDGSGPSILGPDEFEKIKDGLDDGAKVMDCSVNGVFTVKKTTVLEAAV